MKVALYGKNSESLEKILLGKGVTVVDRHREDFDLLISYGGDGAMLGAELARLKFPTLQHALICTDPSQQRVAFFSRTLGVLFA